MNFSELFESGLSQLQGRNLPLWIKKRHERVRQEKMHLKNSREALLMILTVNLFLACSVSMFVYGIDGGAFITLVIYAYFSLWVLLDNCPIIVGYLAQQRKKQSTDHS